MSITPVNKLWEQQANPEIDDFLIGVEIAKELHGTDPEFRIVKLAHWVARLREHYVRIGVELGHDDN